MTWEVEFTDEFHDWWESLTEDQQDDIDASVRVLEDQGPRLKEPLSKVIESSRHYPKMKELRSQYGEGRQVTHLLCI